MDRLPIGAKGAEALAGRGVALHTNILQQRHFCGKKKNAGEGALAYTCTTRLESCVGISKQRERTPWWGLSERQERKERWLGQVERWLGSRVA